MNSKATIVALVIGLASAVSGMAAEAPSAPEYTWTLLVGARDGGLAPVAAARCDRDSDGNPELVVAYCGAGRGALVWFPIAGERFGDPEPMLHLSFEPTGLVSGDFDADGELELALTVAGEPALVAVEIDGSGAVEATSRHRLPAVATRLALDDLPRRDGLPDFVIDLERDGRRQRLTAASPRGAVAGLAEARLEPAGEAAGAKIATKPEGALLTTRVDRDANRELVVVRPDGSLWLGSVVRSLITVDSTDDSVDFPSPQQVGDLPGPDGKTTLREAIVAANNTAGVHVIEFNIPEVGNDFHDNAWWFTPNDGNLGPLSQVTASVTLDGYTQTQNRGNTNLDGPELVLDGGGLTTGHGFEVAGDDCTVIDWVVQNVPDSAIHSAAAANLVVVGCYLGTTVDGTAPTANTTGVELADGTTGAVIGGTGTHGTFPEVDDGNLLSGNEDGVHVWGASSAGNSILGNLVGTDRTGTVALENFFGVRISSWAASTDVGGTDPGAGNLVSGNVRGIWLYTSGDREVTDTLIQGNLVGIDVTGLAALPNQTHGIGLWDGVDTTVGGTSPAARNIVSGNEQHNIYVAYGILGTVIQGNWIGVDAGGSGPVYGTGSGVQLEYSAVVGGADPGAGNVISGHHCGVCMASAAGGSVVLGNLIGTDVSGTASVANDLGIAAPGGAIIGGDGAGEGNVISGNSELGIRVTGGGGSQILGNLVGPTADGVGVLGNGIHGIEVWGSSCYVGGLEPGMANTIVGHPQGDGVRVLADGNRILGNIISGNNRGIYVWSFDSRIVGNTISDSVSDGLLLALGVGSFVADNVIANSGGSGLVLEIGASNTFSTNSIHDNGALGIDLGNDGVTPNDPGDIDNGPNSLRNFPVIASAVTVSIAGLTAVSGTLDTPSPEAGVIEIFGSPAADPSGHGEGETFLGSVTPAADGTFSVDVSAQPVGSVITATFTDAGGSTSEFSAAVAVTPTPLEVCASGCPFTTIQAAIDATVEGDTVFVRDGTYVETISFPGHTITVRSLNGAAMTAIDGASVGPVVTFSDGGTQPILRGFTITNGSGSLAGAIRCASAEPAVVDCVVSGNTGPAAAVKVNDSCRLVMTGCSVSGNTGETTSAVLIDINGQATLVDCDITGNTSVQAGGAAVRVFNQLFGLVTISGSTISGNQGHGLVVVDSTFSIDNTTIRDNVGHGLSAQGASFGCTGDIVSSTIIDNQGWGVSAVNANLDVTRTVIAGNVAGVELYASDLALLNSTVAGNEDGGVVIEERRSAPVSIINCTIASNASDSSGAGVLLEDPPSQVEVVNSIVWGNDGAVASGNLDQIDAPFGGSIIVTYSDVEDGWPGMGNIDAAPLFVDPRTASHAPTSEGDYHLMEASPCVDAGTAVGAPVDDIDGDPRPQMMGFDQGSDEVAGGVFADGFDSGDTSAWTMTVP